jgi:ribosomal protein S27E
MKAAVKRWIAFELSCPSCETDIPEPQSGSLMFSRMEGCPEQVICPGCGAKLKVPKGVK